MDIATLIGMVSGFTLIFLAMGDLTAFVDPASIIIVVGGTIAMTLVSFPLKDVGGLSGFYMYAVQPPREDADREKVERELGKGILMLGRMKTFAQATGWIGTLIGAVLILKNLDDPAAIGPGAALALLCPLYGTIMAYLLFWTVRTKLEVYLAELRER